MMSSRLICSGAVLVGLVVMVSAWPTARPSAQPGGGVQIDTDDIGGVVTGKNGPEAGVWVIAETTDLGTRFAKMVVTDERPLCDPRSAEGRLPGLGARLWPRRLRKGGGRAGQEPEFDRGGGTEPRRRRAVLPGDL